VSKIARVGVNFTGCSSSVKKRSLFAVDGIMFPLLKLYCCCCYTDYCCVPVQILFLSLSQVLISNIIVWKLNTAVSRKYGLPHWQHTC